MHWQLQEAKQRFSEVVRHAIADGPQGVTRHGEEVAVVTSMEEYSQLKKKRPDFKGFLLSGPPTSSPNSDGASPTRTSRRGSLRRQGRSST